jgi:2-polyprenyl-3-methyl-5-hydroxy-6-metoxy-1,4-benzoquinol methylase
MLHLPPSLVRPVRRWMWDRKWLTREGFAWKAKGVPSELADAVESGWLAEGMSVLDVGCGDGDNAAWMAGHGFRAHGIDVSEIAIEKAREAHQGVPDLTFETIDVSVHGALSGRSFDALVDRGCLHGIPDPLRPSYARNVAAWARPGAPFLLTMPEATDAKGEKGQSVEQLLGDFFQIEEVYAVEGLLRTASKKFDGKVFRMRRISD